MQPNVDKIRPVRRSGRRLGRRGEVGLADAPLRAERLVRRDFGDDVHDRLRRGLDGGVRGGFGYEEAAGGLGSRGWVGSDVIARTRMLLRSI